MMHGAYIRTSNIILYQVTKSATTALHNTTNHQEATIKKKCFINLNLGSNACGCIGAGKQQITE